MSSSCFDRAVVVYGNYASGIRDSKGGRIEIGSTKDVDDADEEDSEAGAYEVGALRYAYPMIEQNLLNFRPSKKLSMMRLF